MKYIHIKKLDKYHPGYRDRTLQWAKIYFNMVQGDPEFELIESEIDKWRYVAMVCLELQAKTPLPDSDRYWKSKGFDLRKRRMSLTIQMLHNFIRVGTLDGKEAYVDKYKEEDKDKEKSKRFVPPTFDELKEHLKTKDISNDDIINSFINHYEGNGWKIGSNKMVSWKHTISNWCTREGIKSDKIKWYCTNQDCREYKKETNPMERFGNRCVSCNRELKERKS